MIRKLIDRGHNSADMCDGETAVLAGSYVNHGQRLEP